MNEDLYQLLRVTPSIVFRHSNIVIQHIEHKDWTSLLMMHGSQEMPKVGNWVAVRKGIYKGDEGYVNAVDTFGLQILLVPHLPPPEPSYSTPSKRKCPVPSMPTLFDPLSPVKITLSPVNLR
jgi:hypothetical protein